MDTQKIRTILSAVKCKSFSKTAEELLYTPSALSHMADSLEKELGVKLLKRTSKGVDFSEQGEKLKDKLIAVIDAEESLKRSAMALSQTNEQSVRIGAYFSVSFHILPEIIKEFKSIYPDVSISIAVEDTFNDWIKNDMIDVVFTDSGKKEGEEWIPFMKDRYVAVLPNGVLDDKETVTREDLYEYTYISVNDSKTKEVIDEGKFRKIVKFSSTDDLGVLALVKEGIGVAILPSLILSSGFNGVHTALIEPEFHRLLGFSYRKDKMKYGLKKFVEFLQDYYGEKN